MENNSRASRCRCDCGTTNGLDSCIAFGIQSVTVNLTPAASSTGMRGVTSTTRASGRPSESTKRRRPASGPATSNARARPFPGRYSTSSDLSVKLSPPRFMAAMGSSPGAKSRLMVGSLKVQRRNSPAGVRSSRMATESSRPPMGRSSCTATTRYAYPESTGPIGRHCASLSVSAASFTDSVSVMLRDGTRNTSVGCASSGASCSSSEI